MEKFYLEEPGIEGKKQIFEYIEEHIKYDSELHGTENLEDYIKDLTYEKWLENIENMKDENYSSLKNLVPSRTYFLIRKGDNKVVGNVNIRTKLNEEIIKFGGSVGYTIRPTERKKGYAKIQLYLILMKAKEFNIDKVAIHCDINNQASNSTIKALGGIFERQDYNEGHNIRYNVYWIDVNKSLSNYSDTYLKYISSYKKSKIIFKNRR